jgi:hypothetical protein
LFLPLRFLDQTLLYELLISAVYPPYLAHFIPLVLITLKILGEE